MNNPLDWLWPLVDAREPLVAAHVVNAWPAGVHMRLLDLGFLHQAQDADRVLCPECHGHIEEVIASDGPNDRPRFFISCPEVGRTSMQPEARRQWSVNLEGVADALATALQVSGSCTELSPGRLWRLGRTNWQGKSRDVMLARGLTWADAPAVRPLIFRGRKPIIFVPEARPPDDLWRERIPPILALSQVATLGDDGIDIESLEIIAAIQDAETKSTSEVTVVTEEKLKLLIRQQVKAEEKTSLTDDILVAAYRQHGSVRQAAAFLSQQTGQDVSKDQVHRALQRAGGVAAVLNAENSDSIQRPVASQRRDKSGKRIRQAKPTEEA